MSETKLITSIYVVTDSESGSDKIGDIEGGFFSHGFLDEHIKNHGSEMLLETLANMISRVMDAKRRVFMEKFNVEDFKQGEIEGTVTGSEINNKGVRVIKKMNIDSVSLK